MGWDKDEKVRYRIRDKNKAHDYEDMTYINYS